MIQFAPETTANDSTVTFIACLCKNPCKRCKALGDGEFSKPQEDHISTISPHPNLPDPNCEEVCACIPPSLLTPPPRAGCCGGGGGGVRREVGGGWQTGPQRLLLVMNAVGEGGWGKRERLGRRLGPEEGGGLTSRSFQCPPPPPIKLYIELGA